MRQIDRSIRPARTGVAHAPDSGRRSRFLLAHLVATTGAIIAMMMLATATPAAGQVLSSVQFERQARGEREVTIEVSYGLGTLIVGPADGNHLYRARLRYDEELQTPLHDFQGGRLRIGVEGAEGRVRRASLRRDDDAGELDLRLGRSVPMDLSFRLGVVKAELDLGGIPIHRLSVEVGASDTSLRASRRNPARMETLSLQVGAASFHARDLGHLRARQIRVNAGVGDVRLGFDGLEEEETDVRVNLGVGALEVVVPEGVAVRMTRSGFLSTVNAPGLERSGNTWVSPDWESARIRLRIEVESAVGSITLSRTR